MTATASLRSSHDADTASPGRRRRFNTLVCILLFMYILAGSLVLYYRGYDVRESHGGIFTLQFGFGRLIEGLVTRGEYAADGGDISAGITLRAYRMPVIPCFMATIARFRNSLLLAILLKNLLWGIPLVIGWLLLLRQLTALPRSVVFLSAAIALCFPYLAMCMFMLDFEEGYLIGPLFMLTAIMLGLADRSSSPPFRLKRTIWFLLALLNATLYLIKPSMLPVSIAFCLIFAHAVGSRKMLGGFAVCLLAACLGWGLHNYIATGQFRLATTSNAENGFKGNNALTATYYPDYHLDILTTRKLTPVPPGIHDEWSWYDDQKSRMLEFMRTHPGDIARLFLTKCYVFFLAIGITPRLNHLPASGEPLRPLTYISWAYMCVVRTLMIGCLVVAVSSLRRRLLANDPRATARRRAALWFLLLVFAYASPYLAGYAYHRHVMPLVLPTLAYFLWVVNAARRKGTKTA